MTKANEISDIVRQYIESTDWKFSSDQEGCCVTFKNVAKFGKVFKLEVQFTGLAKFLCSLYYAKLFNK